MAKKIGFALEMKDDVRVRDIDALRKNFDIDKAMEHFASGKLVEWLENRFCDEEAEKIKAIDKEMPSDIIQRQLYEVLGVEPPEKIEDDFDMEIVQRNNEKKDILRQKTSDETIIAHAAQTAFNQGDLADLWNMDESTIYLCGDSFKIRSRMINRTYIGVLGTPKIEIDVNSCGELTEKGIKFENVELPAHLLEKKAEETKPCPKCGHENPATAKFCNECGTKIVENMEVAPSNDPEGWIIPQAHLRYMFDEVFKKDFEQYKRWGIEINANAKFFILEDGKVIDNLTDEQKDIALAYICGGKYKENELLHLRAQKDMRIGWAFTRDSFCFMRYGDREIIPYESIMKFKSDRKTLILNNNREIYVPELDMLCDCESAPIHSLLVTIRNMIQAKT